MARNKKTKADETRELFQNLNGHNRIRWQEINQEGHNFYLDNQLTEDERKSLVEQGMPTFTINRIIPIIEMLSFYATANTPRWQAVGAEGSDADIAAVHSDIADYIWYNSDGQSILSQVINDSCSKSVGYFRVFIDSDDDNGMGEVKIDCLDPFDVYVDPQSRDVMFRDASYIMTHKLKTRSQLENVMPQFKSKIAKATSQYNSKDPLIRKSADGRDFQFNDINENYNLDASTDEIIDYYELYYKVKIPYMNVFYRVDPTEEQMNQIQGQIEAQIQGMRDEMVVQLKEQEKQLQQSLDSGEIIQDRYELEIRKASVMAENQLAERQQQLTSQAIDQASEVRNEIVSEKEYKILLKGNLKEKIVDAVKFYSTKIKLRCVAGDQLLYERLLPSEDYPIIPLPYKWTGTPYPMSAVAPLIGKQKELNKAHQLMIHNASLGSSLRWLYQQGSIDEQVWSQNASAPGALLPVNTGYEMPKEVQPAQLSNAFASIVQFGKNDMEYLAGIYSSMQGDMDSQHDTYRGLLANDEYGTRRVKTWMTNSIHPSLKQLGLVVRDYAQNLYTAQKVFRVVQPNALQESREVQINVPLYNDLGEAIGKWNDYASAKFDVRVVAGNTLPVNRWAYLGELKELMSLGVVDDLAVLAETDIRNKEKIVERKSLYSQLKGQITQQEEQLKNAQGTIETLERQVVQAGIKMKIMQQETEGRKQLVDASAKLRGDMAVAKAQRELDVKKAAIRPNGAGVQGKSAPSPKKPLKKSNKKG